MLDKINLFLLYKMENSLKSCRKIYLFIMGLPKTVIFNFKYFPFKQAIRLPVFVSHRVWLMNISGVLKIAEFQTGGIRIGYGEVGIIDQHRSRTIWQVSGQVEFKGKANIGHGSKISVTGQLIIGKDFCISAASSIVAHKSITIGDNVLISWDSLIIDTDFHKICDLHGFQKNPPMPVIIGNMVWIGCRTLILKGVHIADGVVVAAASNVVRSITTSNSLVAGNPAKVIKENIMWKP